MSVLAAPLLAQRTSTGDAVKVREQELTMREWALTHVNGEAKKPVDPQGSALLQIKEDFKRIQIINNLMMSMTWANNQFDYPYISDVTAEIKTRATRLKANLTLPEPEDDKSALKNENQPNGGQMKASLLKLDHSIMGFVTNPVFQNPGVIDLQLSAKASRDLKSIIELSNSIRKSTDKLSKNAKKP